MTIYTAGLTFPCPLVCVCVCVWSKTVSEIHKEITAQLPALLNPDTFIPCSTGTQNDVMCHVC